MNTLSEAWQKVASMPDVRGRLADVSSAAVGSTAQELQELTRTETKMWGRGQGSQDCAGAIAHHFLFQSRPWIDIPLPLHTANLFALRLQEGRRCSRFAPMSLSRSRGTRRS